MRQLIGTGIAVRLLDLFIIVLILIHVVIWLHGKLDLFWHTHIFLFHDHGASVVVIDAGAVQYVLVCFVDIA